MGRLEMVVTAEATRSHTRIHRSVAAAVVLEVRVAMVRPELAEDSGSPIPMQRVAASSMEPVVVARVGTLELVVLADQALVVTAALIQPDLPQLLIQEVVAVAVEPQVEPLVLAALALMESL